MDSYSEEEDETRTKVQKPTAIPESGDDDPALATKATVEIRSLIERKEELEKKQLKQERHRQRVQVSSNNS